MYDYYIYVYLNPENPGIFSYTGVPFIFNMEPIYVGVGKKDRIYEHQSRHKRKKDSSYYTDFYKFLRYLTKKEIKCPYIKYSNKNMMYGYSRFMEMFLIERIGRKDKNLGPLLNMTDGGDGVRRIHTEDTKNKISKTKQERFLAGDYNIPKGESHCFYGKTLSDEEKRNLSEKFSGELNPFYGKTHSEKQKEKIKEGRRNAIQNLIRQTIKEMTKQSLDFSEDSFNRCRVNRVVPYFCNVSPKYMSVFEMKEFYILSHRVTICD